MDGVDGEHNDPFLRQGLRADRRLRLEAEQARAYGVPHSIFTGRVQQPGEPYFLVEDSDLAIALAEEEADTCPSCHGPKAWCRDRNNQFAFEVHGEQCHATYTLAAYRAGFAENWDDAQKAAMQLGARFRAGMQPDLAAGLDLPKEAG